MRYPLAMASILLVLAVAACGSKEVNDSRSASDAPSVASSALPVTVQGEIDMSLGEGSEDESGGEMLFGSLAVGDEDLYIQIDEKILEAAKITTEPTRVRATVGSKQDIGSGITHYTITEISRL
jgi:hypothetical protein